MITILIVAVVENTAWITNVIFWHIPSDLEDVLLEIHFMYLGNKEMYCILRYTA